MLQNSWRSLLMSLFQLLLAGCSVNGYGPGFEVTRTTTSQGTTERVSGFGILLDTRAATRSISIGFTERFLLCPVDATPNTMLPLKDPDEGANKTAEFDPKYCHQAAAFSRQRQGLSVDLSPHQLRLSIGLQQQNVMHINKELSTIFQVQFNSKADAQGQAVLLNNKEEP